MAVIDSYAFVEESQGSLGEFGPRAGQSFVVPAYSGMVILTGCRFYLSAAPAQTGVFVATLREHSGTYGVSSVATGSALATSDDVDVSSIPVGTLTEIEFTFSGAQMVAMNPGGQYCIEVDIKTGTPSVNYSLQTTDALHSGNRYGFDNLGEPTTIATHDLHFVVLGNFVTIIPQAERMGGLKVPKLMKQWSKKRAAQSVLQSRPVSHMRWLPGQAKRQINKHVRG